MQLLSLQAIFLFYGIFLFSCVLWMSWLFRSHADTSARLWIGAALLSAVATSVTAWRADLPAWLGYQLPNTLNFVHCLVASLAVWALVKPLERPQLIFALVVLAGVLFELGLAQLSRHAPESLVTYVSLGNGLARIVPALWILRALASAPQDRQLTWLLYVLIGLGSLWLLRIPVYWMGLGAHAMDPKLLNWLIFASLLGLGIAMQFAYVGVRYTRSYESRLALARTQARLDQVLSERDALLRRQHAPSGALASQMAHEINQPLAALRLSLETSASKPFHRLSPQELDELLQDIDRISASLERARALAHSPAPQLRTVALADLISRMTLSAQTLDVKLQVSEVLPALALRCDPDLLAAAWVTVLQRLVLGGGDELTMSLSAADPERVRLSMDLPAGDLQRLPQDLQADARLHADSADAAAAFLELLTLDHLVRAHAGHLGLRLSTALPRRLLMDLVLPSVRTSTGMAALGEAVPC